MVRYKGIKSIKELAPNEKNILAYIRSRATTTSGEVAKYFKISPQYASRVVTKLRTMGFIRQIPGKGNSYKYEFKSLTPEKPFVSPYQPKPYRQSLEVSYEMEAKQILDLLIKWSLKRWEPKIIKSSTNLPRSLVRLCELAVECSFGSKLSQEDLDSTKADLLVFQKDLMHLLKIVNGILDNSKLWDVKDSPVEILTAYQGEDLRALLHKVKELN